MTLEELKADNARLRAEVYSLAQHQVKMLTGYEDRIQVQAFQHCEVVAKLRNQVRDALNHAKVAHEALNDKGQIDTRYLDVVQQQINNTVRSLRNFLGLDL
jgi:hypothetical protein